MRRSRARLGVLILFVTAFSTGYVPGGYLPGLHADEARLWTDARRIAESNQRTGWVPGQTLMQLHTVEAGGKLKLRNETRVFRSERPDGEIETTVRVDGEPVSREEAGQPSQPGMGGGNDDMARHMKYLFAESGPFAPVENTVTQYLDSGRYSFVYSPAGTPGMDGQVWLDETDGTPTRLTADVAEPLGKMENLTYSVFYNPEPDRWYPTLIRIEGTIRVFLFIRKDFRMDMTLEDYFRADPEEAQRSMQWQ